MKKMVLLLCVCCMVLLTGCDAWDLLANNSDFVEVMEELEEWLAYSDNTITLRVRRYGEQPLATGPARWAVEGDIELSLRPMLGQDIFVLGDATTAMASWTFSGGGCEGGGLWPVRLFVVGFIHGEPGCFIQLSIVETWIGGDTSFMNCPGVMSNTVVNETIGYRFESVRFDSANQYFVELPSAGIPSPGAAGDFGGWTWNSTWQITAINVPNTTGCYFDVGP